MASNTHPEIAAKKAEIAAKKAENAVRAAAKQAAVAAKQAAAHENKVSTAASTLNNGHCTIERLLPLLVVLSIVPFSMDDALQAVITRSFDVAGVVLCMIDNFPVVKLSEITIAALKQLVEKSKLIPHPESHDHEFTPSGLARVQMFYGQVLYYISEKLKDCADGFGKMDTVKMNALLQIVREAGRHVDVEGLHVHGLYAGPTANSSICIWPNKGGYCYSFRFLLESHYIGVSTATKLKPTHLMIVNGFMRRVAEGATPTRTNYAEVTVVFELVGGDIKVRAGTCFPSKLDSNEAVDGINRFVMFEK